MSNMLCNHILLTERAIDRSMKLPFGEAKGTLQHTLKLQSAYAQRLGAEPEITNCLGGERQARSYALMPCNNRGTAKSSHCFHRSLSSFRRGIA